MQASKHVSASQLPKKVGIGIDFGTSNSAAAIFDGERVTLVQLAKDSAIMPSANYVDRDLSPLLARRRLTIILRVIRAERLS